MCVCVQDEGNGSGLAGSRWTTLLGGASRALESEAQVTQCCKVVKQGIWLIACPGVSHMREVFLLTVFRTCRLLVLLLPHHSMRRAVWKGTCRLMVALAPTPYDSLQGNASTWVPQCSGCACSITGYASQASAETRDTQ